MCLRKQYITDTSTLYAWHSTADGLVQSQAVVCDTLKVVTVFVVSGLQLYPTPEDVEQAYRYCIRTLRLPVIPVMIIGVMRFSYNDRAVLNGIFRHHLFLAVFM